MELVKYSDHGNEMFGYLFRRICNEVSCRAYFSLDLVHMVATIISTSNSTRFLLVLRQFNGSKNIL